MPSDNIHTAGWKQNMVIFITHKSYLVYIIIILNILTQPAESRINTVTNAEHTTMYHIQCIRISLLHSIMRSL
jgi:hypothetical protein